MYVLRFGDTPCERDANNRATTGGHARVTSPRQIPAVCGAFVPAMTLSCPRFPRLHENGKEGVDGSSPSEGFDKVAANKALRLSGLQTCVTCGHARVIRSFAVCSHALAESGLNKADASVVDHLFAAEVLWPMY